MLLTEILKANGLFSNDIKNRLKNNQISINGEKVNQNIDLDIFLLNKTPDFIESGNFIAKLILNSNAFHNQMLVFGFENLFESNIDSPLVRLLNNFYFIKISKKENFLIKKM